ncbi:MAG: serine hydrolase domain-containing protein [bacterium]
MEIYEHRRIGEARALLFFIALLFVVSCSAGDKDDALGSSTAAEEGIDPVKIEEMLGEIREGPLGYLDSVLLVKNGKIVLEEYFHGYERGRLHDTASVTKSVTSALIGIAIEQGAIEGVDQTIADLLPEYAGIINSDPTKRGLQLQHILTMSTGLEWDEESFPYSHAQNDCFQMKLSDDAPEFALERPVREEPGTRFHYSCANTMLLSAIIEANTGLGVDEYAEEHLFRPLGISSYTWDHYGDGLVDTEGGLSLAPVDMAKIGYLFLNHGMWNRSQIIDRAWVEESTSPHIATGTLGAEYGYQWWRIEGVVAGQEVETFFASGLGGQNIFVFPTLDLVVVFTAPLDTPDGSLQNTLVLQDYILPAVLPQAEALQAIRLPSQHLDNFVGEYESDQGAEGFNLVSDGDALSIQTGPGEKIRLSAVTETLFFGSTPELGDFHLQFFEDESGEIAGSVMRIGLISLHFNKK